MVYCYAINFWSIINSPTPLMAKKITPKTLKMKKKHLITDSKVFQE